MQFEVELCPQGCPHLSVRVQALLGLLGVQRACGVVQAVLDQHLEPGSCSGLSLSVGLTCRGQWSVVLSSSSSRCLNLAPGPVSRPPGCLPYPRPLQVLFHFCPQFQKGRSHCLSAWGSPGLDSKVLHWTNRDLSRMLSALSVGLSRTVSMLSSVCPASASLPKTPSFQPLVPLLSTSLPLWWEPLLCVSSPLWALGLAQGWYSLLEGFCSPGIDDTVETRSPGCQALCRVCRDLNTSGPGFRPTGS